MGVTRQAVYQFEQRQMQRRIDLEPVKAMVFRVHRRLPQLGTRKLYHLLKPELQKAGIKLGRDAFRYIAQDDEYECPAGERLVRHGSAQDNGRTMHRYWASVCRQCSLKAQCTSGAYRKMTRWEHEEVLEAAQARLDRSPDAMRIRRATVEHPFGTLKAWMGSTHFLTKTLDRVSTEMSLHVLAYNMKRMMNIIGTKTLIEAIGV